MRPPPRRGRPTLAERSAASGLGWTGQQHQASVPSTPAPPSGSSLSGATVVASSRTSGLRDGGRRPGELPVHCWVLLEGRAPRAGVLLAWRRTPSGWIGRVAYALGHAPSPQDEFLVVAWLPAEQLRPL